ncbi:uncharacterized protein PV07_00861 [Cladophialophora immunda]|uniref:Uncharacterized protein n=1 Tax=Cladophialophora immunda TaxID=569365 RepID=A0A0D2A0Z5_9EURO|nr:uncharacterized protein PV07_00861 [Cladophialophora immunda]KIW34061.1 hypothetical protein PV07_00861 [Cladophialophora immunda]
MANLAYTLKDQRKDDKAVELMTSSLKLNIQVLGPSHYRIQSVHETLMACLSVGATEDQVGQDSNHIPEAWVD